MSQLPGSELTKEDFQKVSLPRLNQMTHFQLGSTKKKNTSWLYDRMRPLTIITGYQWAKSTWSNSACHLYIEHNYSFHCSSKYWFELISYQSTKISGKWIIINTEQYYHLKRGFYNFFQQSRTNLSCLKNTLIYKEINRDVKRVKPCFANV